MFNQKKKWEISKDERYSAVIKFWDCFFGKWFFVKTPYRNARISCPTIPQTLINWNRANYCNNQISRLILEKLWTQKAITNSPLYLKLISSWNKSYKATLFSDESKENLIGFINPLCIPLKLPLETISENERWDMALLQC